MEIQELEKLKMDTLREVADSNLLIAGIKAELSKLEDRRKAFIVERDSEVLDRVHGLLVDSQALLEETKSNYSFVQEYYGQLKVFSEFIKKTHENLSKKITEFKNNTVELKNQLTQQENTISDLRKDLKIDQQALGRDKEYLKKKTLELQKDREYLDNQQKEFELKTKDLWNHSK